jgi:hypothetical protein
MFASLHHLFGATGRVRPKGRIDQVLHVLKRIDAGLKMTFSDAFPAP